MTLGDLYNGRDSWMKQSVQDTYRCCGWTSSTDESVVLRGYCASSAAAAAASACGALVVADADGVWTRTYEVLFGFAGVHGLAFLVGATMVSMWPREAQYKQLA